MIDHDIDLAPFAERYVNDETGAPAYDPAIFLKVILYAYSRGVTSSRDIAGLCREIVGVYREVLLVCDEMGLIGREMFAVDGVKMPSNASKEWSGTREDFQKKAEKLERALGYFTKRHREADGAEREGQIEQAREKQMRTLNRALAKVRGWLKTGKDRLGVSGSLRLGTVEPVFADINHATGLRRFSLRGRRKVNAQWMMYCLAHNIGKIQRFGDIGRWKKERKAEIRQ